MAKSQIKWEDRQLVNNLRTFNARMDRAIFAAMRFHATRGTAYMRKNATWTDRSTNARNGLDATAERAHPVYRIVFSHGMPYGVWLEIRFSGRYAIIRPTIDQEAPQVMRTISGLFGKVLK